MKILFITDLYPIKSGESNTPLTLHNFVFEWVKQGYKVDVIKPNFILNSFLRKKPFYKEGFYEYEGVRILNLNYYTPFLFDVTCKLKKDAKMQRCKDANELASRFTPHASLSDYDVIIAHMPSGIIFANKLAKLYNKPLVCGVHVSDIEVLTKPLYSFYFKNQLEEAYKNAKKIACRSFVLQKKFNELFPESKEKTFVAPSGTSLLNLQFPVPRSPFTILTCANLIKRKNIDKLILAVKDLENFELTIIGDGPELKRLSKLSRVGSLPLQSNIKFLGHLPHEKVLEQMQKSDIFVLPSVNETFGMVYLEAMASGCITVCTKNDGIDGIIIDGKNGFLCEPTIDGIKEVLLRIKNHPNLEEIQKNSFETIKEYSQEVCAKNYLENI